MTTAVTISDTILKTAELFAETHDISRDELIETALKEYMKSQQFPADCSVRERFDAVYSHENSRLDPMLAEIQSRSLFQDEWE